MTSGYTPRVQTLPLPITKGVYRNVDGEALSEFNYQTYDAYINELGWHVKRPGLMAFADLGFGTNYVITGMFWWPHKQIMLAVANGHVCKIEYIGGVAVVTDLGGVTLPSGITPVFTTDGTYAFVVAGGPIYYTDGSGALTVMADADAPTTVSHIDWIDGYLLATTGTNRFQYSDLNAPLSWNAGSFFAASGDADNIVALKVFKRQIFLLGSVTTEVWENIGSNPSIFKRVGGGLIERGIIAPYSVIKTKDSVYWMSDERRFIKFTEGNDVPISTPYDKEFDEMSSVSDCVSNYLNVGGTPFLLFNFPTANRTIVLNLLTNTWSEWGYYNVATAVYERFLGNWNCYSPTWGKTLCGSRKNSVIYELSRSHVDDAGNKIRMAVTSGHVNHGALSRKRSQLLRMNVVSGPANQPQTPVLLVRWKNNNKDWSGYREINLGDVGETWITKTLFNLGIYKTRQWEFVHTDLMAFAFGNVEENVEALDL